MILQEVLRRINFNIGNMDDVSGRAINQIVSNRVIVDQLNSQLRQYANITKGIQDIFSFPLSRNVTFFTAPTLALRSESYYFILVIINGVRFPMDMRNQRDVYKNFQVSPIYGIPNWFMPWHAGNKAYIATFPASSVDAHSTTLTSDISTTDTTIPVASTAGYVAYDGRVTIDNEKIEYKYKDTTNFYGCVRGSEITTAVAHTSGTTVTENNVVMFYSRLHIPIILINETVVPEDLLAREVEVVEEHMEGIIKLVSYNILIKIDPERANIYKIDSDVLFTQYAKDIRKGYYRGRIGTGIRDMNPINEQGTPFGTNMIY